MEGVEPIPGDHWATREFHVKWKRWSYIHCSWDTRETLSQLGGYKRLVNYMKRSDEQQARALHSPVTLGTWLSLHAMLEAVRLYLCPLGLFLGNEPPSGPHDRNFH